MVRMAACAGVSVVLVLYLTGLAALATAGGTPAAGLDAQSFLGLGVGLDLDGVPADAVEREDESGGPTGPQTTPSRRRAATSSGA